LINQIKILRIYTRIPPKKGGMENHVYKLSLEQIKKGFDVTIFFNCGKKVSPRDERITYLPLSRIKPQFIGFFIFYFAILLKIIRKKYYFDIVHIHGDWSSMIFLNLISKLVSAKKTVFSFHDEVRENFIHKIIYNYFSKKIDKIYTTGFQTSETLSKLTGRKILTLHSGVDEIFFNRCSELSNVKSRVVTVSNLKRKKNLNLVLEIAKRLACVEFFIIGEGENRAALEKLIQENSLKNVHLMGFMQPDRLRIFLCSCSVFLFVSKKEGTPTSILEAQSIGLPVVTSKVGGIEKLLKQNYVIDSYDPKIYVDCIRALLSNNELWKGISKYNLMHSENYSWRKVAENINELFSQ